MQTSPLSMYFICVYICVCKYDCLSKNPPCLCLNIDSHIAIASGKVSKGLIFESFENKHF